MCACSCVLPTEVRMLLTKQAWFIRPTALETQFLQKLSNYFQNREYTSEYVIFEESPIMQYLPILSWLTS